MFAPRLIVLQPTAYCNIDCSYCYLGNRDDRRLMSPAVVDAVCEKIMLRLDRNAMPTVVWHAGEPTTVPIGWYNDAYARLRSVCPPASHFTMQSNGIAVDDRWIDLFRRTATAVSVSLDGPQRFHDARRLTRNGKPTWHLAMRGLKQLQDAGLSPPVITVLHPDGLNHVRDYYEFYRDNGITEIGFNIDELEGANAKSSFGGADFKPMISSFQTKMMQMAFEEGFPLRIREVERIAHILAGAVSHANEQVEPWASVVVAVDGSVSTYSPELMEVSAPAYNNFKFGNLLEEDFDDFTRCESFNTATTEIAAGVVACEAQCRYFAVCGGGAPVNKICEQGSFLATETNYCRLSVQASADALLSFLSASKRRSSSS
jgi:uncharacterized protein